MTKIIFSCMPNMTVIKKGAMDPFFQNIIDALTDNGNEVFLLRLDLGWQNDWLPERTLKRLIAFKPDLIISPNHDVPLPLLQKTICPVIAYTADSPAYFRNQDYIRKNRERYLFMHGGWENIFPEILARDYGVREEQNFFTGHMTAVKAKDCEIKRNIGFIGFIGWGFCQLDLLQKCKNNETFRAEIQKAEDAGINSIDYTQVRTSNSRIKTLDALVDLGLECFGIPDNFLNCGAYSWELMKCFNFTQVVTTQTTEEILNSSLISPNLYNYQAPLGLSWRVADVMASNACLISPPKPDLKRISPYIDIPTYESPAECRELCQKLLKDEAWRKDIVLGCQKAIDDLELRPVHLLKIIEQVLHIPLVNQSEKEGQLTDVSVFKPILAIEPVKNETRKETVSLKYKVYYKIWKHLNKRLKKKGII